MDSKGAHIPILIDVGSLGEIKGEFIRFLAPRTINTILRGLPFEGRATLWGNKVYFQIPVKIGKEKSVLNVEKGTIAYWPMGTAFCIFFDQSQTYSAVNRIGNILGNIDLFKKVKNGTKIRIERR